ncbi:MAG: hypothetical protein JO103_06935, partial [Candidatus Eremiobacteraeota bacterium]|nr:hypothetical protein [Candidatus Eremiobacteraeota bacterium]
DVHTFAPTGVISASGGYTFTQQDYFWLAGIDSGHGTPTGAVTFYAHAIGLPRIYLQANEPTTTSGEALTGIVAPLGAALYPATHDIFAVNSTGGLLGFTCGNASCTAFGEPVPIDPTQGTEARVIAPPAGASNYTAAVFTSY